MPERTKPHFQMNRRAVLAALPLIPAVPMDPPPLPDTAFARAADALAALRAAFEPSARQHPYFAARSDMLLEFFDALDAAVPQSSEIPDQGDADDV